VQRSKPVTVRAEEKTLRRARVLFASAVIGGGVILASGIGTAPAQASGCPNPDYPCTPVPPKPGPVGKPSVTFGCGTVTVKEGTISVTLPILPCPGPVIF
jgi:hypothetical protein